MFEEELGGGSIGGGAGETSNDGGVSNESVGGEVGEDAFCTGGRGRDLCTGFDHAEMAAYASGVGNQLVLFDISAFDYRDLAKIGPGLLLVEPFDHCYTSL